MYDASRKCCLELIKSGFVNAFDETLRLVELNEQVRALDGHEKPRDLKSEFQVMQIVMETLRESEKADRTGSFNESQAARMELANRLGEGYEWLSEYLYKSCLLTTEQDRHYPGKVQVLERFALLEEQRDNIFLALKYIKKALKAANESPQGSSNEMELYQHLVRILCKIGTQFHEKENGEIKVEDSKSVLFYRKALKVAKISNSIENQAVCHGLLGRSMMKLKEYEKALKNFEAYHNLSKDCNNTFNVCNANFALSEVYKHLGDLEKSQQAIIQCQEQAKENRYTIPMIFSSISFGQMETAKRCYTKAHRHFEVAYRKLLFSEGGIENKTELSKLCRVMCGVGRANLAFDQLAAALNEPVEKSLDKILNWRKKGGPFDAKAFPENASADNLERPERVDSETQISLVIAKLVAEELNRDMD